MSTIVPDNTITITTGLYTKYIQDSAILEVVKLKLRKCNNSLDFSDDDLEFLKMLLGIEDEEE